MKSCAIKTALVVLMLSFVSFMGCTTVITDVNAELKTAENGKDLGIPVNYNKDYVEVAYNPGVNETVEEEPVEDDVNAESEKETKADDKDNKEADKEDPVSEEEVEEDEDSDEDPHEDEEDADSEEEDDEEEESEEDDLNASMASDNFDAEFYANTYPDVVAVFGSSPEALYKHYLDYGKAEGRSCNAEEYALLNESNSE